jgi:D-glycero-D-manno-heptose 1,7-bisphosphate phosphatase
VITNQPDVGHGLIESSELDAMHELMTRQLPLDAIKVCCHRQGDNCDCRKPKPGMILEAAEELHIDLSKSFVIGDRRTDVEAGRAAGCLTVFIDRDYAEPAPHAPSYIVASVAEAAEIIIENSQTLRS